MAWMRRALKVRALIIEDRGRFPIQLRPFGTGGGNCSILPYAETTDGYSNVLAGVVPPGSAHDHSEVPRASAQLAGSAAPLAAVTKLPRRISTPDGHSAVSVSRAVAPSLCDSALQASSPMGSRS